MATATTVTRGHLAALIGIRMAALLDRLPKRPPVVATDTRTHWAASWFAPVTRAGVMDVFADHTFQPTAILQRGDLAQASARLISLALANQAAELARLSLSAAARRHRKHQRRISIRGTGRGRRRHEGRRRRKVPTHAARLRC
jgi:hypothetical protein